MMRSIFFSIGLFVTLWGITFLFVDTITLRVKSDEERSKDFRGLFTSVNDKQQKVFDPPEWVAYSLMSVGSVTMLYAVALPKRG